MSHVTPLLQQIFPKDVPCEPFVLIYRYSDRFETGYDNNTNVVLVAVDKHATF